MAEKHEGSKFLTYLRTGTATGISEHMGWQMPLDWDLGVLYKVVLRSREEGMFVWQIDTHGAWKRLPDSLNSPGTLCALCFSCEGWCRILIATHDIRAGGPQGPLLDLGPQDVKLCVISHPSLSSQVQFLSPLDRNVCLTSQAGRE